MIYDIQTTRYNRTAITHDQSFSSPSECCINALQMQQSEEVLPKTATN